MEEKITIPFEEYKHLKRDQAWLQTLESAGVDNWQGMEFAQELWDESKEEREQNND